MHPSTALVRLVILVIVLCSVAMPAPPASATTFFCPCGGSLQSTPAFTETGASCAEATAGVSLDGDGAITCDPCCLHTEASCTQLDDGSWQATGRVYYICSTGGR